MNVRVSFACNDPANGDFLGRVRAVDIGELSGAEILVELEGPHDGKRISFGYRDVWFPGAVYKFKGGLTKWAGNWCWDAVIMSEKEARRLYADLMATGEWSVSSWCEGWEGPNDEP